MTGADFRAASMRTASFAHGRANLSERRMNRKRGLRNAEDCIHLRSWLLSKPDRGGVRAALRGRCVRKLSRRNRSESLNRPDAVRLMGEVYGIDMEAEGRRSKPVRDIPDPDIAISMGCNVGCPFIGRPLDDDWGLEERRGISQGHRRNRVAGKGVCRHREGVRLISGCCVGFLLVATAFRFCPRMGDLYGGFRFSAELCLKFKVQ